MTHEYSGAASRSVIKELQKPPFCFQLHPSTNVTAALMLGTRAEPSARAVASRGTLDEVSILTRDIMPRWFLFAGFLFRRVVL